MDVKKSLITALSLISIAVLANPAPVADLSRSSNKTFGAQNSARAGSVEERLAALERVVEARASAQLEMQQQLQTLLDEVSELRGTTEVHNHKLEEILQQQRDIYQEIDRRLGGQSSTGGAVQSNAPASVEPQASVPAGNPAAVVAADQVAASEAAATQAGASATSTMSEGQAYEQAINFVIKDNNYAAAIPAFESFIENYPNSEYTSNSHYWLGQLYYQKSDFPKAQTHFERVVKQYPNSSRVPDALEKLGMVAEKQNDLVAAKRFYNQLIKSFPKSKPAAKARKKLETM
ncbi:tol-pal system protein YbgF [Rheinheimera riviphila]|uniref:Cell division coordinator CpoB n=1 Tax=Rheinheimera riviphila TaxID=1834037 RepID=A0A437R1G5_9GAMM|nr:tol-pal system protein YbgF [Rheinheimera riviphila]RVU40570.1 tol-pal system protein YbgF [Rheinheimera riviphila]